MQQDIFSTPPRRIAGENCTLVENTSPLDIYIYICEIYFLRTLRDKKN